MEYKTTALRAMSRGRDTEQDSTGARGTGRAEGPRLCGLRDAAADLEDAKPDDRELGALSAPHQRARMLGSGRWQLRRSEGLPGSSETTAFVPPRSPARAAMDSVPQKSLAAGNSRRTLLYPKIPQNVLAHPTSERLESIKPPAPHHPSASIRVTGRLSNAARGLQRKFV